MSTAMPVNSRPVFLIDSMNYIFRAYYGLPDTITAPSGMKTNAVLGYLRTLLRIIKEQDPPYIAAAFEGAHSFRRELFAEYKANRVSPPDDLKVQFGYCRQITEAVGIPAFQVETFEADDVIGSIAVQMAELGHPVVIVSGDKDLAQLVDDRIQIYDLAKNLWLDAAGVKGKLGVEPSQVPDLLALLGDPVDNIPGVPGVGGKTATKLLSVLQDGRGHSESRLRRSEYPRPGNDPPAYRRKSGHGAGESRVGSHPLRYRPGHHSRKDPIPEGQPVPRRGSVQRTGVRSDPGRHPDAARTAGAVRLGPHRPNLKSRISSFESPIGSHNGWIDSSLSSRSTRNAWALSRYVLSLDSSVSLTV